MKSLILFFFAICTTSFAKAQTSRICGNTTPRFCTGEKVWTQRGFDGWKGTFLVEVVGVSQDKQTYTVASNNYSYPNQKPESLAKTTPGLCTTTTPRVCIGDSLYSNRSSAWNVVKETKVIAISSDRQKITIEFSNPKEFYSNIDINTLSLTRGCGRTTPRLCVGDELETLVGISWNRKISAKVVAVSTDFQKYTVFLPQTGEIYSGTDVSTFKIINQSNRTVSLDTLDVYLTNETEDVVATYLNLSKVVAAERAQFTKSIAKAVETQNSVETNIFAALLLAKLVRLSTAQVVRDNFEGPVSKYLAELEKSNWKSIQQVQANENTIQFAIHVIAAGVRVRNTQSTVSPENEIRLKALAAAAAKRGTVAKAIALREFISSNMHLIEDLVADPRHGAIGSLVADTAQWLNKQFEE